MPDDPIAPQLQGPASGAQDAESLSASESTGTHSPAPQGADPSWLEGAKLAEQHFAQMVMETQDTIQRIEHRMARGHGFGDSDERTAVHYRKNLQYFSERAEGVRGAIAARAAQQGEIDRLRSELQACDAVRAGIAYQTLREWEERTAKAEAEVARLTADRAAHQDLARRIINEAIWFNERKQELFCRVCWYRDPLVDGNKLHDDGCSIRALAALLAAEG